LFDDTHLKIHHQTNLIYIFQSQKKVKKPVASNLFRKSRKKEKQRKHCQYG